MTLAQRLRHYLRANAIFLSVLAANLFSDLFSEAMFHDGLLALSSESMAFLERTEAWLRPFVLGGIYLLVYLYERPVRRHLRRTATGLARPEDSSVQVRRRLLNEPYFVAALNLVVWFGLTLAVVPHLTLHGEDSELLTAVLFMGLNVGLVTAAAVFFLSEYAVQRFLGQHVLPASSPVSASGAVRMSLSVRMLMLFAATSLIPLLSFVELTYIRLPGMGSVWQDVSQHIRSHTLVFLTIGISLSMFMGHTMRRHFTAMIDALERIRRGDLSARVSVLRNDEMGYVSEVINEMAAGLEERERMRHSLALAKEIQQNLLPARPPKAEGWELAATCLYSEETGGDFYDYLDLDNGAVGVAVADVSGHGVPAALFMVSVRALLRRNVASKVDLAEAVAALNRDLCRDAGGTGQFITLFLCRLEPDGKSISWVRAGHEPALLYDPASGRFEELEGNGMALGVVPEATFELGRMEIAPGQVLVIGTDGIPEARNESGEFFGKQRLRAVVRTSAGRGAEDTRNAVVAAVERFAPRLADDVTLVTIRAVPLNHG
ncbi:SpoIIE family protein phosphatase [Desulfocurvibacter africanus]|uniref:PP2C family protein-serine/threonine phosphatase n=1 Tax=Desulfocurvibacter africanus TaxID=873 RepID=UPI002FD9B200